jgi:hypothetical protein
MRGGYSGQGGAGGVIYVTSAAGGPAHLIVRGNAPVWCPHARYLAYVDPSDRQDGEGVTLHLVTMRTPSRRVTLPGGLTAYGYIEQLTWML